MVGVVFLILNEMLLKETFKFWFSSFNLCQNVCRVGSTFVPNWMQKRCVKPKISKVLSMPSNHKQKPLQKMQGAIYFQSFEIVTVTHINKRWNAYFQDLVNGVSFKKLGPQHEMRGFYTQRMVSCSVCSQI